MKPASKLPNFSSTSNKYQMYQNFETTSTCNLIEYYIGLVVAYSCVMFSFYLYS